MTAHPPRHLHAIKVSVLKIYFYYNLAFTFLCQSSQIPTTELWDESKITGVLLIDCNNINAGFDVSWALCYTDINDQMSDTTGLYIALPPTRKKPTLDPGTLPRLGVLGGSASAASSCLEFSALVTYILVHKTAGYRKDVHFPK